jgi:hypothetical protein
MANPTHRRLTVGMLVQRGQGLSLFCPCGHKTALLPEQLGKLAHPEMTLLDVRRRLRCSMCGLSGASEDIRAATFSIPPALGGGGRAPQRAKH